MKKLIIILILLLLLPLVQAGYYQEIKEQARTFETPKEIHKYLWDNNTYQFNYYKKNLNKYWYDRTGDCTEIARIKYIMLKTIGYKARISHGYINNSKHDYTEYYDNHSWNSMEQSKIIRVGRGIW